MLVQMRTIIEIENGGTNIDRISEWKDASVNFVMVTGYMCAISESRYEAALITMFHYGNPDKLCTLMTKAKKVGGDLLQGKIRYFGNYWGQILIWQVFDKIMERQSTHGMKIMANSMHGQQHYKQFWKMPIFRIWAVAEKFLEGQGYYGLYRELHFHDQFLKSYLIWINGLNVKELLTLSDDGQLVQGYKMHIVTWVFVGYFGLLLDEWDQFDILILFWGNYWNNDDNSLAVLWRELHVWSLSCQILTAAAVMRTLWIMTDLNKKKLQIKPFQPHIKPCAHGTTCWVKCTAPKDNPKRCALSTKRCAISKCFGIVTSNNYTTVN
ncbi:hypothetical protein LXL04_019749 [Taraxacum kok-saghyz]